MLTREEKKNGGDQRFYSKFVKPTEIRHDVAIYRVYQHEKARVERDGGKVKRVALDFELKAKVFERLNKHQGESRREYAARKIEAAENAGIKIVNGRLQFPDMRIEYETRDQQIGKVDVEVASGDYKESQIHSKSRAGMRIYGPDSHLGAPALRDPEIVAAYFEL